MAAPLKLDEITAVCTLIGNEVADQRGFVSMRGLLDRFDATLIIRPLLVEGMLVTVEPPGTNESVGKRWAVLVDSETYPVHDEDLELETADRPLSTRLRNTIAHELVHSLAFRPADFGISLKFNAGEKSAAEFVRLIEDATEDLSPILLLPEKALRSFLQVRVVPLSLEDILQLRRNTGVSRHVLINRLFRLGRRDPSGLLSSRGLRNLAIGLGEVGTRGKPVTRSWPLFSNFDGGDAPFFLREILEQDRLPGETVFSDRNFAMCGGSGSSTELSTFAGTVANPRAKEIKVRVSTEQIRTRPGSQFFFAVHLLTSQE